MQNNEIELLKNRVNELESKLRSYNDFDMNISESLKSEIGLGSYSFYIKNNKVTHIELSDCLTNIIFHTNNFHPTFDNFCEQLQVDLRALFLEKIDRVIQTKTDLNLDVRLDFDQDKNISFFGSPILDEAGNVCKIIGTCHDISAQNIILRSLLNKENDLQLVQAIANIGIWRFNISHRKIFLNKWAAKIILNSDRAQYIPLAKLKKYFEIKEWQTLRYFITNRIRSFKFGSVETTLTLANKSRTFMVFFEIDKLKANKLDIVGTIQDVSSSRIIKEELLIKTEHEKVVSSISNYLVDLRDHEIIEGLKYALRALFNCFNSDLVVLELSQEYAIEDYKESILIQRPGANFTKKSFLKKLRNILKSNYDFRSLKMKNHWDSHVGTICQEEKVSFEHYFFMPLVIDVYPIGYLFIGFDRMDQIIGEEDFEFIKIICEILSITIRRKKYEEELKRKDEDITLMLNNITDAMVAVDLEKRIQRVNLSAKKLVGLDESNMIGKKFNEIFSLIDSRLNKQDLDEKIDLVAQTKKSIQLKGDLIYIKSDGSFLTLSIDINTVIDQKGKLVGSVLLLRDISNEVKLEEQLRHSEKMRVIGQLSGGIAHDFNNLLTGIVGCANILKKKINDPSLMSYLDDILSVSKRAAGLTGQLLIFGRHDKPKFDHIVVDDLIGEVINLLNYTLSDLVTVEYAKSDQTYLIEGDFSQLQNAILNLALNARDAIDQKGVIRIETKEVDLKNIDLQNYFFPIDSEKLIKIDVHDSGVGIPPSILEHIFEPFFTTKEKGKGTGLGLSTVYATIKTHKGSIKVESVVGKGTVFSILLPILHNRDFSIELKNNVESSKETITILVVDDDTLLSSLAEEALGDEGFKVFVANSGHDAIEIYRNHMAQISIVLLDVLMPKMRGDEVYKRLKEMNPEVKVIFASGFTDSQLGEDDEDWMKEPFIQKPYDDEALIESILKALK